MSCHGEIMKATAYQIIGRRRKKPLAVASIDDFEYTRDQSSRNLEALLSDSSVSPYCIDLSGKGLVFTEVPKDVDLSDSTFVYEAQYNNAIRLYTANLDDFNTAADRLPDPSCLMFLHSTGRCGSTLLAKAMNAINGVVVFSEPDIFTQLSMSGYLGDIGTRDAFVKTYRNCLKMFCRSNALLHVFKFRSVVCMHADHLMSAVPHATSLFQYRNAIQVAASNARIIRRYSNWTLDGRALRAWSLFAPLLAELRDPVDVYDLLSALWAGPVLRYLTLCKNAGWLGALRYEDLISNPINIIQALLSSYRIRTSTTDEINHIFSTDSQAGSCLSIDSFICEPRLQRSLVSSRFEELIHNRLANINPRLHPDMILPGRIL